MIESVNDHLLQELRSFEGRSCVSLYMTTHRHHPNNLQDPIAYKNLLKQLESSLTRHQFDGDVQAVLAPFKSIADDTDLWNNTPNGLAIFAANDFFKVVGLPVKLNEMVVVANSFHLKPLRKFTQTADRYQVLALSLHDFQLYEGNRHEMVQVRLQEDIPNTIRKALGTELTEEHLTVASYGGVGGGRVNMVHGHGSRKDELDVDAERFFRIAADEVYKNISQRSKLPLILAALPEHHRLFHKVNNNPFLINESVSINPKHIDNEKFVSMAWGVMETYYRNRIYVLADNFREAASKNRGTESITETAKAAAESRVDVLLLEANRIIPGKVNHDTGVIQESFIEHPEVDDLLDDIGELVSARGGKVVIVAKAHMPTQTGIAATYRF